MPDIPLVASLPAPVHRAVLRVAEGVRRGWWRLRRPHLRGCAIVARNEQGHILLVRHSYRKMHEWHLVTGGVGRGEDAIATAQRELFEEVGLRAATVHAVAERIIDLHGATNAITIFAVTVHGRPTPDRREISEARFFAPDVLPDTVPDWVHDYIAVTHGHQNRSS